MLTVARLVTCSHAGWKGRPVPDNCANRNVGLQQLLGGDYGPYGISMQMEGEFIKGTGSMVSHQVCSSARLAQSTRGSAGSGLVETYSSVDLCQGQFSPQDGISSSTCGLHWGI